MNIYVGNLAYQITEDDIKKEFETFGPVSAINIIKDKFTNESKGFAFVEMPNDAEAKAAMAGLNGKEIRGRAMTVNEARPRESREGGGGGARRGGGGGGRRGGGGGGERRGGGGGGGGGGRRSW